MVMQEIAPGLNASADLDRRIRYAWGCGSFRHTPTGPACAIADDRHCGLIQYPRGTCPIEEAGACTSWKADLPLVEERP